jgi:hypothetical protein
LQIARIPRKLIIVATLGIFFLLIATVFFLVADGTIADYKESNGVIEQINTRKNDPGRIWMYSSNTTSKAKFVTEVIWIKEEVSRGTYTEEQKVFHVNLFPHGSKSGLWHGKSSTPTHGVPIVGLKILELKVEPNRGVDAYGNPNPSIRDTTGQ